MQEVIKIKDWKWGSLDKNPVVAVAVDDGDTAAGPASGGPKLNHWPESVSEMLERIGYTWSQEKGQFIGPDSWTPNIEGTAIAGYGPRAFARKLPDHMRRRLPGV